MMNGSKVVSVLFRFKNLQEINCSNKVNGFFRFEKIEEASKEIKDIG